MNDTELPEQNGFVRVEMVTAAGSRLLTVIVIGSEVTGLPDTQGAVDVSVHVTTSPLRGV